MKGFKQLEVKTRSAPKSEIIRGKLKLSTIKYEGSNMILAGTHRITKQKTVAKRVFAHFDFFCSQILPRNIGLVHFNNFINFPVTEDDDNKRRVLKNDQNWEIELFKLYLANGKTWMRTDIEAESKYYENGVKNGCNPGERSSYNDEPFCKNVMMLCWFHYFVISVQCHECHGEDRG